jgi:asparagine synthase (glutamine-hydrolysing)
MAPDKEEFHKETVRKVADLYKYDCLRANKSTMAWGVEARVPFLSKEFLSYAMGVCPSEKMCKDGIEKWLLRKACEDLLPESIIWRQKEQFSDGVGYGWIDSIKEFAQRTISDEELVTAKKEFPIKTPDTKEALLYRRIFHEFFSSDSAASTVPFQKSIACSTPTALAWSKEFAGMEDPTGRAIAIHSQAVKKI